MVTPIVYGASYSVYVRAVRLSLEEKGVAYRLEEVDIFAETGPPSDHEQRHPFLKIPTFEHGGFEIYEAGAIMRYIDAIFDGPPLMPAIPKLRARADQIISILDSYAYRPWVRDIYVERSRSDPDEAKIQQALPQADTCLTAIEALMEGETYFLCDTPTLADLYAAPMFDALQATPDGQRLISSRPRWQDWWSHMAARPSMAAT